MGVPDGIAKAAQFLASPANGSAEVSFTLRPFAVRSSSPAVTVRQDDPIATAGDLLIERRMGAVPVVDGDDRLVGIVSSVDLLRALPHSQQASR